MGVRPASPLRQQGHIRGRQPPYFPIPRYMEHRLRRTSSYFPPSVCAGLPPVPYIPAIQGRATPAVPDSSAGDQGRCI